MKRAILGIICASGLVGVVSSGGGCGTDDVSSDYAYYDSYVYYGYYPADVYYSGYYWTDPYYYYYAAAPQLPEYNPPGTTGRAGTTGSAGASGTSTGSAGSSGTAASGEMTMGDVLRAMARGENVCPNQVSVTPKMSADACAMDGSGMSRSGVTVVFNGCRLSNGAQFDGTIDVLSTRTLSDPSCGPGTTVSFTNTTTITNLARTTAGGAKLVIPNSTGTTTTNYIAGQLPTSIAVVLDGSMQIHDTNGNVRSDQSIGGDLTIVPSADRSSYTIDGVMNLNDQRDSSSTTLTATSLQRSDACCRPSGGSLVINRATGTGAGTHSWSFGPSCGAVMFDGESISTPACM